MDKISLKQHLKEEILKEQKNTFVTKKRYYYKNSKNILKNIIENNIYYKTNINKLNFVKKVLNKALTKDKLNFISYVSLRNNYLTIYAKNHIGRSELNHQKNNILYIFNQISSSQKLSKVSIMIDKENEIFEYQPKPPQKSKEKAFGIFSNEIKDKILYNKFEQIRKMITGNRE